MSIKMMTAVWDMVELDQSETLVMLALADWSNDHGVCWPSRSQLAAKSRMTERSVRNVVIRLIEKQMIEREEKPGKGVIYRLIGVKDVHPCNSFTGENDDRKAERRSPNTSITTKKTSTAKAVSVSRERGSTIEQALKDRTITADDATAWAVSTLRWPKADALVEWQRFIDSNQAHGRRYKDWLAAWRNWCRSPFCEAAKRNEDKTSYRREPLRG